MPFKLALFSAVSRVPELHELVAAAGGDRATVRREANGRDRARVGGDRLDFFAVGRVPEHDGAVFAGRCKLRAIGGEVERPRPALVLLEIVLECSCWQIPELHEAVVARSRRELSILRDLDGPDGGGMAGQIAHPRAIRLPDDDIPWTIEQALAAGGHERGAVAGIVGSDHPPPKGREAGRRCGRRGRRGRRRCGRYRVGRNRGRGHRHECRECHAHHAHQP